MKHNSPILLQFRKINEGSDGNNWLPSARTMKPRSLARLMAAPSGSRARDGQKSTVRQCAQQTRGKEHNEKDMAREDFGK
jgi:hypothetical protein